MTLSFVLLPLARLQESIHRKRLDDLPDEQG